MKLDFRKLLILTITIVFASCNHNNPNSTESADCKGAVIDEKLVLLSKYNTTFYDENYTGTVVNYFSEDTTKVKDIIYYRNGKIFKDESFYENGDLKMRKPVRCNSIHGVMIHYSENPRLRYEMEYKYGRMDGIGKSYYANGNIYKLVHFRDDKQHGEQYTFSQTGDTLQIEVFENGVQIK